MYKSAIYVRSSKCNEESENSCVMQVSIARLYAESKPDIAVKIVYEDNGYSGLDFLRPGFRKMMEDLEHGKINCIIVKDLSRLGRDYIQLGAYMEYVWPRMGVRVISINDAYDSATASSMERYFMIPMRNYINDMYSRDISIKVRSAIEARRMEGLCTVSKVSYGYILKSEQGQNKIVLDSEIVPVITKIYALSLEGYSLCGIAKIFNKTGIVTPMGRRRLYDKEHGSVVSTTYKRNIWYPQMIKRILTDEIYTGVLVQGKTKRIDYKIKKSREVEESKRYKIYDNHPAIIDKRTFDIVNRLLKYDIRCGRAEKKTHNLGGVLLCAHCGRSMVYRKVDKYCIGEKRNAVCKNDKYICGTYNKRGGCKGISIKVEDINCIIKDLFERLEIKLLDGWLDKQGYIKREVLVYQIKNIYLYEDNKVRVIMSRGE